VTSLLERSNNPDIECLPDDVTIKYPTLTSNDTHMIRLLVDQYPPEIYRYSVKEAFTRFQMAKAIYQALVYWQKLRSIKTYLTSSDK